MGSGAIFTGVNPAYTTQELIHHFKLTKPNIILVEPHLIENTLEAATIVGLPSIGIYLFDVYDEDAEDVRPIVPSWQRLLEHGERDWAIVDQPDRAVAQYAQTSGTSGLPKVAMLPHSYHVSQAALRMSASSLPYVPRRLAALPPFHVFATPICPSSVREGVVTYVMRRFEMRSFLSYIEQFQISETYLAPPVLVGMPLSPFSTQESLKSLRQIWFGGASLHYRNQLPLYELLHPNAKIQPVWGMTEAGWITAGIWPDKCADDSAGRILSNFEVK
jgi:acyl-CoA synthetase (AMP-forming)/AMP-acid ligase II